MKIGIRMSMEADREKTVNFGAKPGAAREISRGKLPPGNAPRISRMKLPVKYPIECRRIEFISNRARARFR